MYKTVVNIQTLSAHLDDPRLILVDCSYDLADQSAGLNTYMQAHIKGAVFADVHDDLSGPPTTDQGRHPLPTPAALNALFSRLGIARQSQVIIYDNAAGCFAGRLWWLLRYMGHATVAVLDGGRQAWQQAGLTMVAGEETNKPTIFQGTARKQRLVTVDQVPKAKLLVDSRAPARYRGEIETLDKIAGHIPGAVNHYWKNNLDELGCFKPPSHLRQDFSTLFGTTAPQDVVFYCGSGVTACHNLLAVAHAGFESPCLYAGSWSDWCSDPARPVALG